MISGYVDEDQSSSFHGLGYINKEGTSPILPAMLAAFLVISSASLHHKDRTLRLSPPPSSQN